MDYLIRPIGADWSRPPNPFYWIERREKERRRIVQHINHPDRRKGERRAVSDADFTCKVCGKECPIAPEPPERAVCEEHCEDHDFQYDRHFREHRCIHCDMPAPYDWYDIG